MMFLRQFTYSHIYMFFKINHLISRRFELSFIVFFFEKKASIWVNQAHAIKWISFVSIILILTGRKIFWYVYVCFYGTSWLKAYVCPLIYSMYRGLIFIHQISIVKHFVPSESTLMNLASVDFSKFEIYECETVFYWILLFFFKTATITFSH